MTKSERGHGSAPDNDRVDIGLVLSFLRRRLPIVLGVVLLALLAGVFLTLRQTPTYISQAEVLLDPNVEPIAPISQQDRLTQQGSPSETYIDTQVKVVTSAANVAAVVQQLRLDRDPRFLQPGFSAVDAQRYAAGYLLGGVRVFRPGATYTINITFESTDPVEAARVANAFAQQYTMGTRNSKEADDGNALKELGSRMAIARAQASGDSATFQNYRLAHNLPRTTDRSLTEQEISSYNQEVTSARAQAVEDAARLATARQQLRSGSDGDDVGEALGSPVISSLRGQQANYTAEIAALESKFGPLHPDMERAKKQLAAVNDQIKAEIGRVISNLAAKAQVSQQRLASLNGSLSASQGTLRRENVAMVGLQDYEQRADASKALYESYLTRYKELAARGGMRQAEASILHPAEISYAPASPNMVMNLILSIAFGLGLGFAVAILLELTFRGMTSGEDLERRLGVRFLGAIPELKSVVARKLRTDPTDSIIDQPRSAFAESFRNLRASIAFAVERPKIIAITSALPSDGKTTLAICLARAMAAHEDKILLIDCDMRRRGVSTWIGGERQVGILEVLNGTAHLNDAIITDERTGLKVLPLSAADTEDHDLLTGDRMDALLKEVAETFDAIILDTAPVLPMADARLLLSKADASVLAVRWRKTPEAAVRSALRLLPPEHVLMAGVVLSRVDMSKQSRFGNNEYSYYRQLKKYYA